MLFNSYVFIFAFLPVVLAVFYALGRFGLREAALGWLVLASLFFYGWWNPAYLWLMGASIVANFGMARAIVRSGPRTARARWLTAAGIVLNLGALAYYKYTNFFLDNLGVLTGLQWDIPTIILPLAISFFTFQQISFLADSYAGQAKEYNFVHYCLFVTFFPQLIAGPIVHHGEMMPQFERRSLLTFDNENLAIGITIFLMGLFKKVVLADGIAPYATPVFDDAERGATLTFLEAWGGVLAYTFQIYFDFSGYSDMAIGLARMFGIVLPLNFSSPYKAASIIDFWRRWHMTLSRFLRDYIYIPLGGNRKGPTRRHVNLMTVMLVGGLWHGAGWTFVIWGGLHGLYLVVNHGWNTLLRRQADNGFRSTRAWGFAARCLTFLAVVFAWVFFRAESLDGAVAMLRGMAGLNGISIPVMHLDAMDRLFGLGSWLAAMGVHFGSTPHFIGLVPAAHLAALLMICWYLPNTEEMLARYRPALDLSSGTAVSRQGLAITWSLTPIHAALLAGVAVYTLSVMTGISEFLYFQF